MTWIIDILILFGRGFGLLPRERKARPKQPMATQPQAAPPRQFFPFADRYRSAPAPQSHSASKRGYVPPWAESLDKE